MEHTTIEQRVAEVILQKADTHIEIEGRTYDITPATPATLFLVSGLISQIPEPDTTTDNPLQEVLRIAKHKDAEVIGKIAAALILGAKRIKENHKVTTIKGYERKWSWRRFRYVEKAIRGEQDEFTWLSDQLLNEVTIDTLAQIITKRLADMQVGSFFGLTTSLSGLNIARRTKEVVETVRGE